MVYIGIETSLLLFTGIVSLKLLFLGNIESDKTSISKSTISVPHSNVPTSRVFELCCAAELNLISKFVVSPAISWLEPNIADPKFHENTDIQGPVSMISIIESTGPVNSNLPIFDLSKIMIFGDSDFVKNKWFYSIGPKKYQKTSGFTVSVRKSIRKPLVL